MDKGQTMRFSKKELELLQTVFGSDDNKNIFLLRSHFLQLNTYKEEVSAELLTIIKKLFIPSLNEDVPIAQQADIYNSLGKVHDIHPEMLSIHILAKDILSDYLSQQFDLLLGIEPKEKIVLTALKRGETGIQRVTNMIAFIEILGWIEQRCSELVILSKKPLTKEEEELKVKKNSTK